MTCERFGMMYYVAGRNYDRLARGNMSILTAQGAYLECIYGYVCALSGQKSCTPV